MDGSLEEILEVRSERDWLLTLSRYWLQLERYFAHFPAEQILVVDSDELRDDRAETLRRIFRFLAVDDQFQSTAWDDVHNTAARPTRRTRLGQTVYAVVSGTVGRERAAALVARSPAALRDPFRRQVNRPIVSADVRTRLATELADDVERLREHTGLAFAGWSL
jgi:hypothetical protein